MCRLVGTTERATTPVIQSGQRLADSQCSTSPPTIVISTSILTMSSGLVSVSGFSERITAVNRFSHVLTADETITDLDRQVVAFSPDGSSLVYAANEQLYLRMMNALESNPIPGTDEDAEGPFFSPDSQWVAYFSLTDLQLEKIALSGGASVTICDSPDGGNFGASWAEDGTIVFGRPEGVFGVSANGGTPELIVEADADEQVYGPQALPGGEWVLFTTTTATGATRWNDAQIVVQSVASGERRVLVAGGSDARYLPTGHLVYAIGDVLYGVAFDINGLQTVGGPVSLVEDIARATGGATAAANYDVSVGGSLVYLTGESICHRMGHGSRFAFSVRTAPSGSTT